MKQNSSILRHENLNNLGNVSSEGGPLLIADSAITRKWQGATCENQNDYQRACDIFIAEPEVHGKTISIADGMGLIWDMGGSGTSDIFQRDARHLVIVRAWLDDCDDEEEAISVFAHTSIQEHQDLGALKIETGIIAILWAPESGTDIKPFAIAGDSLSIDTTSINGSGLLVKLEPGTYRCLHDEFTTELGDARRLHLIKQT